MSFGAHEYFHTFNVKRIRPIALGPFDYDREVYTTALYVSEGFTSYYTGLILRQAGFTSPDEYLSNLSRGICLRGVDDRRRSAPTTRRALPGGGDGRQ
jgi:predicted metalloprotease with PDZ domain